MRQIKAALLLFLALTICVEAGRDGKIERKKRLGIREKRKIEKEKLKKYIEMRKQGFDEVSNTKSAAEMRDYRLRKKKQKGLIRKKQVSIASVLFPGVSPEEYRNNEEIVMVADLVDSAKTQVPYEYYDLPFCKAPKMDEIKKNKFYRKNLGARLQGHELKPSPYVLNVKQSHGCRPLCVVSVNSKKLARLKKLVARMYYVQMSLDQLPVLMRSKELNYAARGYPVGFLAPPATSSGLKSDESYLYNHLKFTITYREAPSEFEGVRITGFDVHPVSINHEIPDKFTPASKVNTCTGKTDVGNYPDTYLKIRTDKSGNFNVMYSYEVEWVESDLAWSDRWDVYLIGSPDDEIHLFSIVNSFMIVLFLTGAVGTILVRALRRDIAGYNEMQTLEEAQEETGWKLVHGDVFRPPEYNMFLSVAVGTGAQLGTSFFLTLMCSILGWLNPMRKGAALTAMILLYVLSGTVAGYMSARLCKFCDGKAWKRNSVLTATALPGLLTGMFTFLNIFLTFAGAATAVSFLTILVLFLLWTCVSTPLVLLGAFLGLRAKEIEVPTKINQIARVVPPQPLYLHPCCSMVCGGLLPFGAVCIELAFIMSAMWLHQIYYLMGFLMAVLFIVVATCAEVSIVMTYLRLCSEDHRWWWPSFLNCAGGGFHLWLYSVWFLTNQLDLVGFLPISVYMTYMTMISICFGCLCGAVGTVSSFYFNKIIYSAVKID